MLVWIENVLFLDRNIELEINDFINIKIFCIILGDDFSFVDFIF